MMTTTSIMIIAKLSRQFDKLVSYVTVMFCKIANIYAGLHVTYVFIRLRYSLEFEHLVFIVYCMVQQVCVCLITRMLKYVILYGGPIPNSTYSKHWFS